MTLVFLIILEDCLPIDEKVGHKLIIAWAVEQGFKVKFSEIFWNSGILKNKIEQVLFDDEEDE